MAVMFPNVLVVHPSVQAQTLADFVRLAQAKPGTINYGSSGSAARAISPENFSG
jgi:tripartite-type tricarboxylate transporter receptor subunit TctC